MATIRERYPRLRGAADHGPRADAVRARCDGTNAVVRRFWEVDGCSRVVRQRKLDRGCAAKKTLVDHGDKLRCGGRNPSRDKEEA